MWSKSQIERAAINWRAVADVLANEIEQGYSMDEFRAGMTEGYASALEMILRDGKIETSVPYLDHN